MQNSPLSTAVKVFQKQDSKLAAHNIPTQIGDLGSKGDKAFDLHM